MSSQPDKPAMQRGWLWLLWSLLLCSLVAGATAGMRFFAAPATTEALQRLPQPKALIAFSLEDQWAQPFGPDQFKRHWSLVFFGFSSCPDLCPLALQKMAKVKSQLNAANHLQLVYVSLDPERDTASLRQSYASFFDPQLLGVSGTNQMLAQLADFFGAGYSRTFMHNDQLFSVPAGFAMPKTAGDDYQVNHSTRIFLVNSKAELIGSFEPPHQIERIVEDLRILLHNFE